jgi:hypothetical protein
LLYVDDFEGAFCWFSQFSQVWVSNATADEDFIVEAEFVRNALAVFRRRRRFEIVLVCGG